MKNAVRDVLNGILTMDQAVEQYKVQKKDSSESLQVCIRRTSVTMRTRL